MRANLGVVKHTKGQAGMRLPSTRRSGAPGYAAVLLGAPLAFLDDEDLPAPVIATGWADVVHHVRGAAGIALHEDRDVLEKVVSPAIPLTMPADSLLR